MFPGTLREDWVGGCWRRMGAGWEDRLIGEEHGGPTTPSRWAGPALDTPGGTSPDRVSACERPVPTANPAGRGLRRASSRRQVWKPCGQGRACQQLGAEWLRLAGWRFRERPRRRWAGHSPRRGWCGRGWRRLRPRPALAVSPGGQVAAGLAGTGCPRAPPPWVSARLWARDSGQHVLGRSGHERWVAFEHRYQTVLESRR